MVSRPLRHTRRYPDSNGSWHSSRKQETFATNSCVLSPISRRLFLLMTNLQTLKTPTLCMTQLNFPAQALHTTRPDLRSIFQHPVIAPVQNDGFLPPPKCLKLTTIPVFGSERHSESYSKRCKKTPPRPCKNTAQDCNLVSASPAKLLMLSRIPIPPLPVSKTSQISNDDLLTPRAFGNMSSGKPPSSPHPPSRSPTTILSIYLQGQRTLSQVALDYWKFALSCSQSVFSSYSCLRISPPGFRWFTFATSQTLAHRPFEIGDPSGLIRPLFLIGECKEDAVARWLLK